MLAAAILAAGESSRMGTPKALLSYRGRTFLEHLLDVTHHPRVGVVRVVLGAGHQDILSRVPIPVTNLVINENWQQGQLSSIRAAIKSLPPGLTDGLLLCLVDHPLVSKELVETLVTQFYSSDKLVALPVYEGKRGHPVIFSKHLYDELLAAPDETGARAVVWAHSDNLLEVPTTEEDILLNVNDPETLKRVLGNEEA